MTHQFRTNYQFTRVNDSLIKCQFWINPLRLPTDEEALADLEGTIGLLTRNYKDYHEISYNRMFTRIITVKLDDYLYK